MALSTYPGSIPTFQTHRNLLDDVDADHINFIQRELTAVAAILGVNPHVYNNLDAAAISTTGERLRRIDYGSVTNRLDAIQRDEARHCFRADTSEMYLSPSPALVWTTVPFANQGASKDPFEMTNGVGATLRKAGFWALQATVFVVMDGATDADNEGIYQAAIDTNGQWADGVDRKEHHGAGSVALSMSKFGFFTGGTQVNLIASQNALANQRITSASLSGFLVRESV